MYKIYFYPKMAYWNDWIAQITSQKICFLIHCLSTCFNKEKQVMGDNITSCIWGEQPLTLFSPSCRQHTLTGPILARWNHINRNYIDHAIFPLAFNSALIWWTSPLSQF